jgi:hypothetical protein
MTSPEDKELSQEDIKVLKDMVEREKAVSLIWGWVKAFLYVAVPAATLYSLYKSFGGQP